MHVVKQLVSKILDFGLVAYKHPIETIILTLTLPFMHFVYLGKLEHSIVFIGVKAISYLFMGYFWACLMLSVTDWMGNVSKAVGRVLRGLFLALAIIIFVTDIFLLYKFDAIFDPAKISIMLGVDPETIREFWIAYIISPVSVLVILSVVVIGIVVYKYRDKISFEIPGKFYNLSRYCFVVSLVIFISLGVKNAKTMRTLIDTNPIYTTSSINRVVIDTYRAWIAFGSEGEIFAAMDNNPESIIENNGDIPYVVFILGESADRNKMHGYGYSLENTPFLDNLLNRGEAVAFTDTLAPANSTTFAMEYIFTFYEKEDTGKWFENQNLIDIFGKSGYYTTWVSNQSPRNINGNMDEVLAKRSHQSRFTSYSSSENRPYDEEVLPLLDNCLRDFTAEKQFYVIHIQGSHGVYKLRYPKAFAKFHAADEQESNPKWAVVKAEYDNTFLYTDYLMEEIIKRFADKDCLLVYLSDHGNEVYDGRDFCGHSGENLRNRHMVEIPFVVWGSEKFWAKRPELKQRVFEAKDRPFMTDDFIHFLLDITGIKTTSYDPTKSVINDNFNGKRVRMYGGQPYEKQKDTN